MELKESIAQEVIYSLSVLYKTLLIVGTFLFIASILMTALYLLNSNISLENEYISDSTLQILLVTSILFMVTSVIFRYFRNIVRVKTRPFRTERCRR
jgi:hypothetical protein